MTGANGGLGQAIARAFLEESSTNQVWLGVRNRRDQAELLAAEFPNQCTCLSLDVTSPQAWDQAVQTILAHKHPLDVLVNNAGHHRDSLLANLSVENWNLALTENLNSVFYGCQAVLRPMIAQRHGRIINISSLSALLPPPGQSNYAAAKAGVVALTQSLAKEVARIGITINAVCPGFIDTGALATLSDTERKLAQEKIPMRRFGLPREVACAVQFLACPQASYITGSILKIDGGIL